jgi:type I restriction enzyme, S subunit
MNSALLGEHAKLIRGITFKPSDKCSPNEDGAVVCMRTKNVQAILDESDLIAVSSSLVRNHEKMLSKGDILVSSANSWNLVGKCCQVQELKYPSVAGGFISILRPRTERLDSTYLYQWFSSDEIQLKLRSFGNQTTNISNLNHKRTLALSIPLPPLADQKRIAKILDAADALRTKRRESIAQLDTLLQSTFLDMFGDPVTNPMGWETNSLGVICEVGSSKRVFVKDLLDSGVPFYRGTEIGKLGEGKTIDPQLFISREHYDRLKSEAGVPKRGDLLMPSICPDGRIFSVQNNEPFYFKDGRVLWVKVDGAQINSIFLRHHLKHLFAGNYNKIASGTTFAELKIFALKGLSIQVPPVAQQNGFAAIVESIEQQKATQRVHLAELDTLFASLQQRAFNGSL